MWTRSELKENGMRAFQKNYWICVVIALILGFCGANGSGSGSSVDIPEFENDYEYEDNHSDPIYDPNTNSVVFPEEEDEDIFSSIDSIFGSESDYDDYVDESLALGIGVAVLVFLVVMLLVIVISVLFSTFLTNVLIVGGYRFFILNSKENPGIGELGYGFGKGRYWKVVSTMFLQGLYIFLWSLLFVIPGIIKAYEYYMVPFILADKPELSRKEAFELSKQMMDGNKWDTFVLELSFLGWDILSAFTCGILGVFYVNPYKYATYAELYICLRDKYELYQNVDSNVVEQNPYYV